MTLAGLQWYWYSFTGEIMHWSECDYAAETALLGIVQLSIVHTTDEARDLEQDEGAGTIRTETGRIKAAESRRGFVNTWRKLGWSAVYWD